LDAPESLGLCYAVHAGFDQILTRVAQSMLDPSARRSGRRRRAVQAPHDTLATARNKSQRAVF
jgi:hypothetical protein